MKFFVDSLKLLSKEYYIRNFLFGLIFTIPSLILVSKMPNTIRMVEAISFITLGTLLYPYSRFVYESVIKYVVGENFWAFNGIVFITAKSISMLLCWIWAIFIAPIGIGYLVFKNYNDSKKISASY